MEEIKTMKMENLSIKLSMKIEDIKTHSSLEINRIISRTLSESENENKFKEKLISELIGMMSEVEFIINSINN